MQSLNPACQEALEQHCLLNGLVASDPALIEIARLLCGAAVEQSFNYWLSSSAKRALLEALARRFGDLDADQLALADDLFTQDYSIDDIMAAVSEAREEAARRRRDGDGPGF